MRFSNGTSYNEIFGFEGVMNPSNHLFFLFVTLASLLQLISASLMQIHTSILMLGLCPLSNMGKFLS